MLKVSFLVHPWTSALPSMGVCLWILGCPWPASQPVSSTQPTSQPASCHPAGQQPRRDLPPSSQSVHPPASNPLKPTKTIGFHRFLLYPPNGLESTFWVPVAPQMTPNDLKVHPRSCPGSPKWSLKAAKVTTQLPKIAQWHPMCTQWLPTSNQRHPKHSKSEPKGP